MSNGSFRGYRTISQHLNDLKKENFSLKLRIYFLEERIQQKYEESSDDVYKRNIELKVEAESLKQELQEKQLILDDALSKLEALSNENEAELQRRLTERQHEITHMQELLETKVQLLQEEAQLARDEAEQMACQVDSESQRCLALEREMVERMEECGGSMGPLDQEVLAEKNRVIRELTNEKGSLRVRVEELEGEVQDLSVSLERKERDTQVLMGGENHQVQSDMQRLIDEQQGQLSQYESAAGQCVTELQKAQSQVHSLQTKIRESESRNQKLQVHLGDMELELRSAREEALRQERNIHNLTDNISSKETEAEELYRVVEEQNKMLCSLKELANKSQLQHLQVSGAESIRGQGEVLGLQASLFQAQLELQAGERAQRQASRTQEDLSRALQRLESDLQGALLHRRDTERHNQELQVSLEQARCALQQRGEQMKDKEGERRWEEEERDKIIRELRSALSTKERLVEDYCELLEQHQDPREKRDSLLQKLRQRIRDRDKALERAVDEKFRCVEEKEEETRRLQLLLREKERDLERQRCVLSNNEETITSLDVLLRGKGLELEQLSEAWRGAQRHLQEGEERQGRSLRERDALITQLQTALHTRTQETEDLRGSLLGHLQVGPAEVLEELKARLQLKDRLFQELLSDRTRQAQEHQEQVQDLLNTIGARDQYIQDSAGRLGEVMNEQTVRLQELRRQLTCGPLVSGSLSPNPNPEATPGCHMEVQAVEEELRLVLRREKEAQEEGRSQAARLENVTRTLHVKEEIIKDFQRQLVDPSGLPLVERLTQEIQELRESLVQQEPLPLVRGPALGRDRPARLPEFGELTSDDEDDDANSDYCDSVDEEDSKLTAQTLASMQGPGGPGQVFQDGEGVGLLEVQQLVEQKRGVERELVELKAQLEKAGFSSLSQMRRALFSLQAENEDLKQRVSTAQTDQSDGQEAFEEDDEEEAELDVTIEEEDEEESAEQWDGWEEELGSFQAQRSHAKPQMRDPSLGKRRCTRPVSLDLGALLSHSSQEDDPDSGVSSARDQDAVAVAKCDKAVATVMCEKAVRLQQESRELQERLMVSEATVQAQAEQIKDYRDLLTETSVQQDSKQIQVDLQDMGYETCGRSENEAEREDTSSPEFDDLEMCTSLDCGSQWWPANTNSNNSSSNNNNNNNSYTKTSSQTTTTATSTSPGGEEELSSLQRLVEDLRSQLSRSQGVIRGLQSRLRSLSTSSEYGPSTPRKVSWSFQASPSQSGAEDDEGWQSSDGGPGSSRHPDKNIQELVYRVGALEDQLRKGGKGQPEEGKAGTWAGKFDTLIQDQARELSHLRQRLREGRSVGHILVQHLGDTTKAFEELLRANDIDYYMGQSFRDQLAQSSALAQRVSAKISGREQPEAPDDKTELLAIRLSKELQQKDKVIESLRAKLHQQPHHHHHHHALHHPHRTDTPCSSHALSETTDQSDRISFVSDEQGSTNEDLELCSDMDAVSECGREDRGPSSGASGASADCHSHSGRMSLHRSIASSIPPSIASSHGAHSCGSCPSMHCSPHKASDTQCQTAPRPTSMFSMPSSSLPPPAPFPTLTSAPYRPDPASFVAQRAPLPFDPHCATLRPRFQDNTHGGFLLADVQQELQMLQRQLGHSQRFSVPQSKAFPGFSMSPHQHADPSGFLPLSYRPGFQPPPHGFQPPPLSLSGSLGTGAALKPGSSLLESSALWDAAYGARPMSPDLMKEHLREIRSLRQRLEDSIQTNDRLRQQLEDRLANISREKGAPTNIYIQGLDSVGQLSGEIRLLKEENLSLLSQLKQASRDGSQEAEQLREAVLVGRARLKEAELEAERAEEQSRRLQAAAQNHGQEVALLKQDRQQNMENVNRLQHEVVVLQQQLCESRGLLQSLQCELHMYHRHTHSQPRDGSQSGDSSVTFDPRDLQVQLENRLTVQIDTRVHARRQLFNDNVPSPPVRDTDLFSPAGPLSPVLGSQQTEAVVQATLQGQAPDGSFANRHGRHAVGHIDDFKALQQQILEGSALVRQMESAIHSSSSSSSSCSPTLRDLSLEQSLDPGFARRLQSNTKTLHQILDESSSLLKMFWRAALPEDGTPHSNQEQSLKDDVITLRQRLSEQDEALKDALDRLKSSNRTKDSMEHFIVSQLSRTRDVLKKAKTNLQENERRISSLRYASCSPPSSPSSPPPSPSSSPSSSSRPQAGTGEEPGLFCELSLSPGWGVVSTRDPQAPLSAGTPSLRGLGPPHHHQRPLQAASL